MFLNRVLQVQWYTAHVCPSRVIEDELQDKEVYEWGLMLLLGLSSDK